MSHSSLCYLPQSSMAAYPPQYQQKQTQQHQQQQPRFGGHAWGKVAQQPPFSGAPPIPTGVSVNPQQWQAGYWQYNPAYNQNQNTHQQHALWIPSQRWNYPQQQQSSASQQQQQQAAQQQQQQQQQQQANYNPYKRQPRPPSAEYLATKLVENPLGLFGMDEKNPNYGEVQTPWVWQPRNLDEDDESESSQSQQPRSRSGTDPNSNGVSPANSRKNSDNTNASEGQESFTAKRELQPTFSINIVRTPDHYRRNSVSTDNSSPSRPVRGTRSVDSALSAHMASLSTSSPSSASPSTASSSSRRSSMPSSISSISSYSASPTKPEFPPTSLLGDQLSDEPVSMLSPLIIAQTPKPSPLRTLRNHATYPIIQGGLDPIPESNSSETSVDTIRDRSHHNRPHPSGSLPVLPKSQGSLTYNGVPAPPPNHPTQPIPRRDSYDEQRLGSRHTTFIDPHISSNVYTAKPTSPPRTPSPRHIPSRSSSRHSSRSSSTHASPTYPTSHVTPPTNYPISPRPSPPWHGSNTGTGSGSKHSPPEPNHYQHRSSSSSSTIVPKMANPLPPPPNPHPFPVPSNPPYIPVQQPAPSNYHEKVRRGYWNRRGDHLTLDGYIVFAPQDKAFPNELRNYPAEEEGYQDHNGTFAGWVQRPELPQSLPRMGKPPECPYEKFVVYEYR